MQIAIDTPYVTVGEFARRSGQSDSAIRREIEQGHYVIRPKAEGSKSAVLINMVHMAMEAAEQAERVRRATQAVGEELDSVGGLPSAAQARDLSGLVRGAKSTASKPAQR